MWATGASAAANPRSPGPPELLSKVRIWVPGGTADPSRLASRALVKPARERGTAALTRTEDCSAPPMAEATSRRDNTPAVTVP